MIQLISVTQRYPYSYITEGDKIVAGAMSCFSGAPYYGKSVLHRGEEKVMPRGGLFASGRTFFREKKNNNRNNNNERREGKIRGKNKGRLKGGGERERERDHDFPGAIFTFLSGPTKARIIPGREREV